MLDKKDQNKQQNNNPFPKMEEEVLDFWEKGKIFEKSVSREPTTGKDYVFYDGPPFATGLPHYGHIVASVMKDAVPRYWTMKGYRVERRWGWDCHGLPIENLAEKEMNLKDKTDIEKIGIEKFNDYCCGVVMRYAEEWKKVIKRIGRWIDMENDYKTMNPDYMESIWWVFKSLWDKGLIYKGHKAMHICPRCGTTLSNFEVTQNYKDIKDLSVVAKFKVEKDSTGDPEILRYAQNDNLFILAWTTTPWTLIGNVALAVGGDIDYVMIGIRNQESGIMENYIMAKERMEEVLKEKEYEVIMEIKGKDLVGLQYEPLFDYYANDKKLENRENGWKVYGADFVTTEDGTGVVHIAPAFGEDDMNMGKEYDLPFVQHVDGAGKFKEEVEDFAGMEVKPLSDHQKTDIEIIKHLAHKNLLFSKEKYEHSYPHCWRCETPLLNYATESWFVEVTKIKEDLIKTNKDIRWVPEHIKEGRFGKWLESARDWAISRNRYWGAPLPVWICDKCDEIKVFGSTEELENEINKTVFIVRHGESIKNLKKIHNTIKGKGGELDLLTEKGEEETKKFAKKLKDKGIEIIISSDFNRTKQTAGIIAKELGLEVIYNKRLREVDAGDLNGKRYDIPESKVIIDKRLNGEDVGFPNGENWTDLRNRLERFYQELTLKYFNKKVLIVSHGDPLVAFEAMLKSKNRDNFLNEIKSICSSNYIKSNQLRELDIYLPDLHKQFVDKIEFDCKKCDGKMKRIPEVLDCWFESGSMPYAQEHYPFENKKKFEKNFPADFIAEGVDQTRGWFYTLHVLANALKINNKTTSSFKNVIVNGIVLAEDGQKMSKRLNNYPDPMELVDTYSVDAMRYYLLSSPVLVAENLNFFEEGVKEVLRKVEMILWNVYRFYEMYAPELKVACLPARQESLKVESSNILDKWILARLNQLIEEVTKNMDNYIIPKAVRPIEEFINDLSTWHIRRSRDRFKGEDKKDKMQALETTGFVLIELSKVMAPFMPFIAEQIWQKVTGNDFKDEDKSVHLEKFPRGGNIDNDILEKMIKTRGYVELILSFRDMENLKVRQPLNDVIIAGNLEDDYKKLIADECNIHNVISPPFDKKINTDGWKTNEKKEVILNQKLTDELKQEGVKREIVRLVNNMRKNAGFTIKDRINLYINSDSEIIKNIVNSNENYVDILNSTLSYRVAGQGLKPEDSEYQIFSKELNINGEKLVIKIQKI